ncbi:MAG: 4'-phosphopantetheinyl transferase superfamily protein [Nevskia sp.]|nr:4'-phosphopantetheinyl transferase superfamily protein [Nevskia sp.]
MSLQAIDWLAGSACRWTPLPMTGEALALPEEEAALVVDVAERRRGHFIAGRVCARAALAALGHADAVIGRTADGAPAWPDGVTGSIAHCGEAAVAIAASTQHWAAFGIDIEIDRALPDDAAAYVLDEAERDRLAELPGGLARWALPAFSAKECVHKCLQPLRGLFLEFGEVTIAFSIDSDRYRIEPKSARAQQAMAGFEWHGELRRFDGLLLSLLAARRV